MTGVIGTGDAAGYRQWPTLARRPSIDSRERDFPSEPGASPMTVPPPSQPLPRRTLGEIVSADARAAAVFDRLGVDYCCHGDRTLQEAATDHGVSLAELVGAIAALEPRTADRSMDDWDDLGALTRHIVTRHHAYVRDAVPKISAWLDTLVDRHGSEHPEIEAVRDTFAELSSHLMTHAAKEENILFPYIETLAHASGNRQPLPPGPFGTIINPIRVMENDHEHACRLAKRLRTLTGNYEPPAGAGATCRLCYEELSRFHADLRRHVHLENRVLFPRAVALEDALS
jgi:regulator of cell morphogenesis and NO signaling